MKVLGIETSCDETSVAILENPKEQILTNNNLVPFLNTFQTKANIISSQINKHRPYGGVIPELSAREHTKNIQWVFLEALYTAIQEPIEQILTPKALKYLSEFDLIAVTTNPGLASALKVGLEFSKSLAFMVEQKLNKKIPIVNVNHLEGHLLSCFYHQNQNSQDENEHLLPHLHLLVSGGNTQLFLINNWQNWQLLGQTLDDAVGECLDKVGRMLGLPYPAGVEIAKIAKLNTQNYCNFTIGMKDNPTFDFSYSGHKTAVRYFLEKQEPKFDLEKPLTTEQIQKLRNFDYQTNQDLKLKLIYEVCVSAQFVVMQQLENRLKTALNQFDCKSIGISGGVSANLLLRQKLQILNQKHLQNHQKPRYIPELSLTGDNAVMIALAGIFKNQTKKLAM
jgi:N6-L-threonylcarbamoyladenine synthase